jgi:hypothetical protein
MFEGGSHAIETAGSSEPAVCSRPRKTKVAIVGFCESTRGRAPYDDPSTEIWACNHLHPYLPKRADGSLAWDRWMDIHTPEWSAQYLKPEVWADHKAWLEKDHGPGRVIYMQQAYPEFPNSVAFPVAELTERFGRAYFTSAIAYQIALAISLGFSEIQLWGIDLRHDTEYGMQRPCAEYWAGRAEGMGIKLVVPDEAAVLHGDGLYGYAEIAGSWAEMDRALLADLKRFREQFAAAEQRNRQVLDEMATLDGAIQHTESWITRIRQRARGGVL